MTRDKSIKPGQTVKILCDPKLFPFYAEVVKISEDTLAVWIPGSINFIPWKWIAEIAPVETAPARDREWTEEDDACLRSAAKRGDDPF